MRNYVLTEAERAALKSFFASGERSGELRVLESRIRENLMTGRLPEDYQFIQRWLHGYCKGKVASYVAWGKEPAQKIAKTLLTMIRKKALSPTEIATVLNEVELESVKAFSGRKELFDPRSRRLAELRKLLAT
jgi:hypothetical protein